MLLEKALAGEELAISRLLTKIEYFTQEGLESLQELIKRSGKAHVIGITGSPGAGKSTLISELISEYVRRGHRVGVILIDPSSPFSMGSFMGNRIRMVGKEVSGNVFIRSIASRGNLGGISSEALMLIEALDGLGFDRIIVETVGAGQTDTDVVNGVHTIAVVSVPGTGDEIQALKAGIMEIGDVYIVNKADKVEAEMLYDAIRFALDTAEVNFRDGWTPKIIKTIAIKGVGIKELVDVFEEHLSFIKERGLFEKRIRERRMKMIELMLRRKVDEVITMIVKENSDYISEQINEKHNLLNLINEVYNKVKEKL
ncbi:methylmalonyl Co-A mutase-associated GTPase MeaB [Sulfurisphaera ohwakuensis]|uniref:LAO/AO transport system kinase n=1 Tax=Sulfurisphaera ohwakuensis TaxID=69656 RepID=A0A650CIT5_SULOH|nr:methylmalonyl Co-A mutase-associated GTPase MeaB [Sulfurisphaera ohwakuensis]MBB5253415.1 LAO/AO transport system kinase [Sulfurisphaera ohwakuensis]QGR17730.1 methylmalonyl Co-A mutase-associated GTPase MeaB [Sulfurisphaera ohwakuensis]